MAKRTSTKLPSNVHARAVRTRDVLKLYVALDDLAAATSQCGPNEAAFASLVLPARQALSALAPEQAADAAITLVRTIFLHQRNLPGAFSTAAKLVGNAARRVKRMAARGAPLPSTERLAA